MINGFYNSVKFLYNELESEEVSYVGCTAVADLAANHPGINDMHTFHI